MKCLKFWDCYCKTLGIWGIKIVQFNESDLLAQIISGIYDIPRPQIIKKFDENCFIKLYIEESIRIANRCLNV